MSVDKNLRTDQMRAIARLSDAVIPNKALVLLDIDDTTLHLRGLGKQWWRAMQAAYYEESQCSATARTKTLSDWIAAAERAVPERIDSPAIDHLLQRIQEQDASLIFLTARNAILHDTTLAQLAACGLSGFPVVHSEAKGAAARILCTSYGAQAVVFVDDMEQNVTDVQKTLEAQVETLYAYHFIGPAATTDGAKELR